MKVLILILVVALIAVGAMSLKKRKSKDSGIPSDDFGQRIDNNNKTNEPIR